MWVVAGCVAPAPVEDASSPEVVFRALRDALRSHAYEDVFMLLGRSSREQLQQALQDPGFLETLGGETAELRQLTLAEVFGKVLERDRLRYPEQYRCLSEGSLGRTEYLGERCELRCFHAETEQVRVLILELEEGGWRIRDLL